MQIFNYLNYSMNFSIFRQISKRKYKNYTFRLGMEKIQYSTIYNRKLLIVYLKKKVFDKNDN